MADAPIRLSIDGHVAVITVCRPDKLNALDLAMLKALEAACVGIETDSSVRAVILTGEGKAFSAGGDVSAWADLPPEGFGRDWVRVGHKVFDRVARLRVPVIAALNGHALGGGLELAGAADFRIAQPGIRIGLPETSLGMVPGWSGTQRLVRRFGAQAVRRMVLGGEIVSAEEALALGIVDQLAEQGGALAAAHAYAGTILSRGPAAIEIAKLMISAAENEDREAAVETLGSILVAKTGDLHEGVSAFGAKRAAQFRGEW